MPLVIIKYHFQLQEYQCGMGEKCCKLQKKTDSAEASDGVRIHFLWQNILPGMNVLVSYSFQQISSTLFDASEFVQYDPTQEPIFPSELQVNISLLTADTSLFTSGHQAFLFCPIF